ncbi:hypothetical protein IJ670_07130, partial [bacterium]|nr:hypothetical protein [bacterium]
WGYQAISRKYVRESGIEFNWALKEKTKELNDSARKICNFLGLEMPEIEYSLPWNRSFEIRIKLV